MTTRRYQATRTTDQNSDNDDDYDGNGVDQQLNDNHNLTNTLKAEVKKALLYHWDDLPEWQKDNHYIHHGYVGETSSFKACFDSLFYLHNETVNIYSHLIPGFIAAMVLASSAFYLLPIEIFETTSLIDYMMFALFLLGASTCLTLSSIFHCIHCHSLTVSTLGNKLDYLGIVALIVSSGVVSIHYSFIDAVETGLVFISITLILGTLCAIVSLKEKFRHHTWRPFRAAMFTAFGLSNVLPVLYGIYTYGFQEAWQRCGLGFVLAEAFFYISGATIYAARVPERFAPGKYDYFGHSHQIFHFFVVIAACCHATALLKSYINAHQNVLQDIVASAVGK